MKKFLNDLVMYFVLIVWLLSAFLYELFIIPKYPDLAIHSEQYEMIRFIFVVFVSSSIFILIYLKLNIYFFARKLKRHRYIINESKTVNEVLKKLIKKD